MNIVGISGSLRAASLNTALLRAAASFAPEGVTFVPVGIGALPHFNEDLGGLDDIPEVAAFRAAVAAADAVLIATPEYNYSIPGALKNAIDWASRPANRSPLVGKPVGIVSASPSFVGGARAQQHLKTVLLAVGAPVFPHPEVLVGSAGPKFEEGALVDARTRDVLRDFVAAFARWAAVVRGA
jgi:chromate reductase